MQSRPQKDVSLYCEKCNEALSTSTFIEHMAGEHKDDKPLLNCTECEVAYNTSKGLITHLTQKHFHASKLLPLQCGYGNCCLRFDDLSKGTRHYKRHTAASKMEPKRKEYRHDESCEGARSIRYDDVSVEKCLRSIRNDPGALVKFLRAELSELQLDIEPFVAAIESGRCKPLEHISNDADMPQLFDLKDFEPDLDLDDVSSAAITNLDKSTVYQGHNNKTPMPYTDKHLVELIGWKSGSPPKYAINIPLPRFSLHPPPEVAAKYHAHNFSGTDAYAVSANISTRGAIVDIHEDRGTLGVTVTGNKQRKLWMLYPGLGNRPVFEKENAISQRFAQCESALTGGRFAVTLPGEAIVLPPGWLHATLTINHGVLFGSTITVAEGVSAAAQSYKHDVFINQIHSFDDLKPLVGSLQQAVMAELDEKWREALSYLCSSNILKFKNNRGKRDIENAIEAICSILSNKEHQACEHCRVDLLDHFPLSIRGRHGRATKRRKLEASSNAHSLIVPRLSRGERS